jgi:O-antigen/teichoic acid export membrane protein
MIPFDASGDFHPLAEGNQLRRLAVRGAAAALSAQALSLALRIVPTVVLARLLTPSDFGVVTMVTTFSLLLMSFGQNGFNEAVIQRDKINRFQASNLFWINCAVGLTLTVGFAAGGSLLARFFQNPLVANVTVATSLVILITAASDVHVALLKRAMRFPAVSANDVIALIVYSTVGILLAWRGWGYWALVAATIAQALSTTVGAWWLCRWIPSMPRRGLGTRSVIVFAAKVYGRYSANYFTRNFDNLLVGWRFNALALGFYKKAYDLFALSASQLTSPINNVALAALSRLNDDPARFKKHLANSLAIVAFIGMAVGADLTLVGKDVVRLILGSKWSESGRIFQLFGPGIGIMLLYSTVGWIHLSIGEPGRWLRWTLLESAVTASMFFLALRWGPAGVAGAWSVSYWTLSIPAFWYAGRPIGFGVSSLIRIVWRYAAASLIAALATTAILRTTLLWGTPTSSQAALGMVVTISALFVTLYLGAVILLHGGCAPIRQLVGLVRELAPLRDATRPAAELV